MWWGGGGGGTERERTGGNPKERDIWERTGGISEEQVLSEVAHVAYDLVLIWYLWQVLACPGNSPPLTLGRHIRPGLDRPPTFRLCARSPWQVC